MVIKKFLYRVSILLILCALVVSAAYAGSLAQVSIHPSPDGNISYNADCSGIGRPPFCGGSF